MQNARDPVCMSKKCLDLRLLGGLGRFSQDLGAVASGVDLERDDFDRATCFFDFLTGRGADGIDFERELLGQVAATENFDTVPGAVDETGLAQALFVDNARDGQLVEVTEIDRSVSDLESSVVETTLGQTTDEGHLAAFESETETAAGTGLLTLVSLAAGFAVAGAFTAAEPLDAMTRTGTRFGIMKSNGGRHGDLFQLGSEREIRLAAFFRFDSFFCLGLALGLASLGGGNFSFRFFSDSNNRSNRLHALAAQLENDILLAELLERMEGRTNDVGRVTRAERLGEKILDSGCFDNGANATTGDQTGTGRGRRRNTRPPPNWPMTS